MTKQPQPATGTGPDDLLTMREVAKLLRASPDTLRNWRIEGVGPPSIQYRPHGAIFYLRRDLESWLESRRTTPNTCNTTTD